MVIETDTNEMESEFLNFNSEDEKSEAEEGEGKQAENGATLDFAKKELVMPSSIEELMKINNLAADKSKPTFSISDISADDEVWLVDIPKTVDPRQLKGQNMYFGDKSKFKLNDDRYVAVDEETNDQFTCVFATGNPEKPFKTVNLQPEGSIVFRKKLANIPIKSANSETTEVSSVPFPKNLKIRHPFFGADQTEHSLPKKRKSSSKIKIKKEKN